MDILITGGCGFVGRHFISRLDDGTNNISVVDNLVQGGGGIDPIRWDNIPSNRISFINQDCRKFFVGNSKKYDLVIHLAAVVGGRLTIERNPLAVAEDLSIDADFWKWAVETTPGHIISFSSSAAYPVALQENEGKKLKESDINFSSTLGMPDLTYGWAKLTNEYLGLLAASTKELKVATYRPFSGFGEDQSLDYPFPSICKRAAEKLDEEVFEVWGSGLQSRDFVHIDDIVDGVLSTYQKITDGSAVNLCSGVLTTFKELASLACKQAGYFPRIRGNTSLPEGVFSRVGDPARIHSLGWVPKISLAEGVKRGVEYQKLKI
jgi:GDP-L-fucose synthase